VGKQEDDLTTEPTALITPSTLLEELVERSQLSWVQVTVVVELVLMLFLVGAAYLSGILTGPLDAGFWRIGLIGPAVIAYALLTGPLSRRLRDGAIAAFRPLVPLDEVEFRRMLTEASLFNRRREWVAAGVGAGGMLLVSSVTWLRASVEGVGWLVTLYELFAMGLMCGIVGLAIYSSLAGTRLLTELSRYPLNVSVYNLGSLEPIARWSLGSTLSYIGGITLSLLFIPRAALLRVEVISIYIPLTLTAVLSFFLNLRSVHGDMVEAKQRELTLVRKNLLALSETLQERTAQGQIEDTPALLGAIKAWTAHEEWVRRLPEWPYTTAIKRNLVLSLLMPVVVGFVRETLASLLRGSLPWP
jgi:hypothetical protein